MAEALRILQCPDGTARAVVREDDGRITLAKVFEDGATAEPLFVPTDIERLITFAEHAATGHPNAITHTKAIPFLAALALSLLAVIDDKANRGMFR